jgi:hypothetical protein
MVLILTQDSCTVCAECTIALKLFLMHLMVLLGDEAQVEAHFVLIGDGSNLEAR